jgi:hypothetical protein
MFMIFHTITVTYSHSSQSSLESRAGWVELSQQVIPNSLGGERAADIRIDTMNEHAHTAGETYQENFMA